MEPKILKTEAEYNKAIELLEQMGDEPGFESNTDLVERFELFSKLVSDYEQEHFRIKPGDPIAIVKMKMNYLGLSQKDLEPYIGSKGTVSEVLNKKRSLSKSMIRKLSIGLKIDEAILLTDYELGSDCLNENKPNVTMCFSFTKEEYKVISSYRTQVQQRGMLLNVCPL